MEKLKGIEKLIAFSTGMISGAESGAQLVKKYQESLQNVTPHDMMLLEQHQLNMGITVDQIKESINKIINLLYNPLKEYKWELPIEGSFLYYLMMENRAFEFKLNSMKKVLRSFKGREESELAQLKREIISHIETFKEFLPHYNKKEDILFSYVERHLPNHQPLQVMWSIDDDVRRLLKELEESVKSEKSSWQELNKIIGLFFFAAFGMIQKEELILFPVASEVIPAEDHEKMHLLSFDYPFPFITPPTKPVESDGKSAADGTESGSAAADAASGRATGGDAAEHHADRGLTLERATLLFNTLPLDITYVDEENKVRYFNKGEERHFYRSDAVIGRDVKNCHPPESLHIVEQIVESFKSGERDEAQFWIRRGEEQLVLIRYFAVRTKEGEYKGVMEVSQEISQLKKIEGERRLLEW